MKHVALWGLGIIFASGMAWGTTHTWDGTAGAWSDGTRWENGVPGADGDVVIHAGEVLLSESTPDLASLTLNGGTLVFSNWTTRLTAATVDLVNDAVVTLPPAFTNNVMSNRVWIVCEELSVADNARIDADRRGYEGGHRVTQATTGYGPGGGAAATRGAGGGHGGRGGSGNYLVDGLAAGGNTNGSAITPLNPGSGGGTGSFAGEQGGPGGGAILLQVTHQIELNGLITADGGNYQAGTRSGGGSGGSIYATCTTVTGNGTFSAQGGNGFPAGVDNSGGAGAGGRIALHYKPAQSELARPAIAFLAGPGTQAPTLKFVPGGEPGTVYFSDDYFLNDLTLVTANEFTGQLIPGSVTSWSPASLIISNTWIRFPTPGFDLNVQNDLIVKGSAGRLDVGATSYQAGDLRCILFNDQSVPAQLHVGGDLRLDQGALYVFAAATNAVNTDYGAHVSVVGDLVMAPGTLIRPVSHPENGGSVRFSARDVIVAGNARIDADFAGFSYDQGYGKGIKNIRGGGGGYGGTGGGGQYVYAWGGAPYGAADDPRHPGSGGGSWGTLPSSTSWGGRGGGLIRIEALRHVVCNGVVTANGEYGTGSSGSGGGSGGGINITCQTFAATNGLITAEGRIAGIKGLLGGGGGGGRIALRYAPALQAAMPQPSVRLSAAGGIGIDNGDIGTIYLPDPTLLKPVINHLTGQIVGITAWQTDSLVVSNARVRFVEEGFQLTVTNHLTVTGTAAGLEIGANAVLKVTQSAKHYHLYNAGTIRPRLQVGGDMTLSKGAAFRMYSVATNEATTDHGALVTVAGHLKVDDNSRVYPVAHPIHGGSVLFRVNDMTLTATGGINADEAGYYAQTGPGQGVTGGARCGGAGYGGQGGSGSASSAVGGATYGSETHPLDSGSGGATLNNATTAAADYGGCGGGLIRMYIERQLTVDGLISANGASVEVMRIAGSDAAGGSGGGSGGTVFLHCRRLAGNGVIQANGGSASVVKGNGGGGGGRIAVYRMLAGDHFTGLEPTVAGGSGYESGGVGSVYWGVIPPRGTVFNIR